MFLLPLILRSTGSARAERHHRLARGVELEQGVLVPLRRKVSDHVVRDVDPLGGFGHAAVDDARGTRSARSHGEALEDTARADLDGVEEPVPEQVEALRLGPEGRLHCREEKCLTCALRTQRWQSQPP